jgi:hypothetical protein
MSDFTSSYGTAAGRSETWFGVTVRFVYNILLWSNF